MTRRRSTRAQYVGVIVMALTWLVPVEPASACACCSNDGQRYVEMQKIDAFAAGILSDVRFAEVAHLYTGEADLSAIEGITAKSSEFHLAVSKSDAAWQFEFGEAGGGGTLTFVLPKVITRFEIDLREPGADTSHVGPGIYKEWRLTTSARGSGMFKAATGGNQQATLILHGRGNSCTDVSQFNAWTLILHGAAAELKFFGDLAGRKDNRE